MELIKASDLLFVLTIDKCHDFFMYVFTYFELEVANEIWPDSFTHGTQGRSNHYFDKWLQDEKQPLIFWNRLDNNHKGKLLQWYFTNKDKI